MKKLIPFCFLILLNTTLFAQGTFKFTKANTSNSSDTDHRVYYNSQIEKYTVIYSVQTDSIKKQYMYERTTASNNLGNNPSKSKIDDYNYQISKIDNEEDGALDSLQYLDDLISEFKYKRKSYSNPNWLPVGNSVGAQLFYNQQLSDKKGQALSNNNIIYNTAGQQVSLMTEIYSDYFGPFRVGFGALLTNNQSNTSKTDSSQIASNNQKSAMQTLLGGGGNAIFSISYPLFTFKTNDNNFNVKSAFTPKFNVDVPTLGTTTNNFGFNEDIGVDFTAFYTGKTNTMTFFTTPRFAYVTGNSVFYTNLNKPDKQGFFFNQVNFGIAFNSTFRLSIIKYFGSSFIDQNSKAAIAFSVIPN